MPEIDVYGMGGDCFSIECRQHRLVVDQPLEAGGTDTGPTPTELFVASLPACVAFYGRRFLERHDLPDLIAVRASWETAERPARVTKIDVVVTVRSLPADLEQRFRQVIEHCTIHNTLSAGVETSIDVQHPTRESSLAPTGAGRRDVN